MPSRTWTLSPDRLERLSATLLLRLTEAGPQDVRDLIDGGLTATNPAVRQALEVLARAGRITRKTERRPRRPCAATRHRCRPLFYRTTVYRVAEGERGEP